jgi:hypothetical protein
VEGIPSKKNPPIASLSGNVEAMLFLDLPLLQDDLRGHPPISVATHPGSIVLIKYYYLEALLP